MVVKEKNGTMIRMAIGMYIVMVYGYIKTEMDGPIIGVIIGVAGDHGNMAHWVKNVMTQIPIHGIDGMDSIGLWYMENTSNGIMDMLEKPARIMKMDIGINGMVNDGSGLIEITVVVVVVEGS